MAAVGRYDGGGDQELVVKPHHVSSPLPSPWPPAWHPRGDLHSGLHRRGFPSPAPELLRACGAPGAGELAVPPFGQRFRPLLNGRTTPSSRCLSTEESACARVCGFRAHEWRVRLWPGAPLVRPNLFGYVHYYCLLDGLFRSCVVDSSNCPVAEQQHGLSGVRVIDDLFESKRGQFIVECFRIHSSGVGRDYGGRWCSRSRCRGRHNGRSNRFGGDRGGRRHCCRCSNGCRGRLSNGMRDGRSCLRGSRAA